MKRAVRAAHGGAPVELTAVKRRSLLTGTALAGLSGLVLLGGVGFVPTSAFAADECSVQVNDGVADLIVCGSGPYTSVTYDAVDDLTLELRSSSVTPGGVTVTDNGNENITVETSKHPDFGNPNIVNNADNDGALNITTNGTGDVKINHNVGTYDGQFGQSEGIFVSTSGAGADITVNTASGTFVKSNDDDGIDLTTSGGANITVDAKGEIKAGTGAGGSNGGDVGIGAVNTATTGNTKVTLGATGTIGASGNGIESQMTNAGSTGTIEVIVNGKIAAEGADNAQQVGANGTNGVFTNNAGSGTTSVTLTGGAGGTGTIVSGPTVVDHGIRSAVNDGNLTITTTKVADGSGGFYVPTITSGGTGIFTTSSGDGDIKVTNAATIDANVDGISASATDVAGNSTVDITNNGSIGTNGNNVGGVGILVNNQGAGTTTVTNNSLASINSDKEGIKVVNNGGALTIINGDGKAPNPDGLINANLTGIYGENFKGGSVVVYNGLKSDTLSQVYTGGEYGIFARTHADAGDVGAPNTAEAYNLGLVQTDNTSADAVVYGRASADLAGAVFVGNGIVFDKSGNIINANARLNGYTFDSNGTPVIGDTNGIELVKMGGDGSFSYGFDGGTRYYGVAAENHGSWDFTRSEDYLSFNTWSSGNNGDGSYGGIFAPGGSAVLVRYFGNSDSAYFNLGTTIGQGSFGDPVLDVRTTFYNGQTGQNQFYLYNAGYEGDNDATFGIIGSRNIPSSWSFSPDDLYNFGNLQRSGDFGYLEDNLFNTDDLQAFALAADDILLNSSGQRGGGARVWIDNDGVLVGRIYASTGGANDGSVQGFHMNNWGTWFTHSDNVFDFGANDEIYNHGLVQTATDGELVGITRFRALNLFQNDSGLLSMMDGGEGDRTTMDGSYGTGDGTGYLGVDVFFAENNVGESDRLYIGDGQSGNLADSIGGSTGVIIHKTNEDPGGLNTRGIDVVEYDLYDGESAIENPCSGPNGLCKEGDAFYVDAASQDYENFAGYGTVRHGVFASVLRQDTNWDDFELVTDFAPDVALLPGLITGAQNIWHETGGVVRDHVYGNYFPLTSEGGSGADYMEPAAEPVSTGGAALWARISGSWTDRDTEVTQDFAGVPIEFDTSFDQDTYSILGGADYTMGNFRAGVFGGVIKSDLDFDSFDSSADYTGGTVGGYLAFTHGGFYADAEVKADFLDLDYDAAIGDASANVTNIGVLANTGYRMEMGRFFIEPNASLAYVNTDLDDDNVGGAEIDFSNGDSLRGGIGAKLGGTFAGPGGGAAEVAFVGKLWNEFEDENTVTLTDNITGDSESFTDDIDGIFGEVGGVATFWNSERTTSGFVSGGVQFNDDFLTVNARAGIRKRF